MTENTDEFSVNLENETNEEVKDVIGKQFT